MIGRIRSRDAFQRLRRSGQRVRVDPLWCTYVHDPTMMTPCVAFAISRATGNAVTRNRLRRRLRAILDDSDVAPGLFLIGVQPAAAELTFDQLSRKVAELISRLTPR